MRITVSSLLYHFSNIPEIIVPPNDILFFAAHLYSKDCSSFLKMIPFDLFTRQIMLVNTNGDTTMDTSGSIILADNNLGLAIIERWTYHFLDFYNKRSNPRTTLHDSMVAPFLNKNVLMARVGIKDDTSYRKFEDTKLSEFFGIRRGRKPLKKAMTKQAYPVVEVSPENLLTLPQRARPASATGSIKPQREIAPAKESTSKTCVVEEDDNLIEFSMNSCYILLFGLVVALQVTKKCEKLFFPGTSKPS